MISTTQRIKFMTNNIYNIDAWAASTNYSKNNIVTINNLYYYCYSSHTSSDFSIDLASGNWVGYISDRGIQKPYFNWKSSYRTSVSNQPKFKEIQFGGYIQTLPDDINNLLPSFSLSFDNIDLLECQAILHFLETRSLSAESFCWLMPAPRGIIGYFRCREYSDTQNFYNNYTITAKFDRSVL